MRNLNDWANQYRNQYGYAAEYAEDDLERRKGSDQLLRWLGRCSGSSSGGGTGASAGGVNDYSEYIEEMNRAQQEAALAELRAAYEKNLAGLDRTQQSISPTYQAARNQAAGNAARQQRRLTSTPPPTVSIPARPAGPACHVQRTPGQSERH